MLTKKIMTVCLFIIYLLVATVAIFQYQQYTEFVQTMERFKNVGKRFTGEHGQELCLRIKKIEEELKIDSKPCTFD